LTNPFEGLDPLPNLSQQRALPRRPYRYVTDGVALVGAGVIAFTPTTAPRAQVHIPDVQLTTSDEDIAIDFVRHGEDAPPGSERVAFAPEFPGSPLSDTGQQQAQDVAHQLFHELGGSQGVAGFFSGQDLDVQQTAEPFGELLKMTPQILPGLNEIDGGIYANLPISSPAGILYQLTPAAWVFGLEFVQMPGSTDFNGVAFDQKFSDAVQTMYNDVVNSDVLSANGEPSVVAYASEASITTWVLMNVNNPDLSFFLPKFLDQVEGSEPLLSNAGVVKIMGNPEDGWTVVSFDGQPVPQDPGLLTELFVDVRDLITAPQTATYNIFEAALSGDATAITNAFEHGIENVGSAIVHFPESVVNDIVDAVQNLGTEAGSQATGEMGTTLSDAVASLI
jgi:hypothetical protein